MRYIFVLGFIVFLRIAFFVLRTSQVFNTTGWAYTNENTWKLMIIEKEMSLYGEKLTGQIMGSINHENFFAVNPYIGYNIFFYMKEKEAYDVGQWVEVKGNIDVKGELRNDGETDYSLYRYTNKSLGMIDVDSSELVVEKSWLYKIKSFYYHFRDVVRTWFRQGIEGAYEPKTAYLLLAMFLGERTQLDTVFKDHMTMSGVSHVIAISGLHIGVLTLVLDYMTRIVRVKERRRFFILSFLILVYLMLLGYVVSALRAAIMGLIRYGSIIFRLPLNRNRTLLFSFLVCLLFFPQAIASVGFYLSYGAVIGILFVLPILTKFLNAHYELSKSPFWMKYIVEGCLLTLSVFLTTLPLMCLFFDSLAWNAFVGNLIILPVVSFFYVGGLTGSLFQKVPIVWPIWSRLISVVEAYIEGMSGIVASLPGNMVVSSWPILRTSTYYLLVILILVHLRGVIDENI